ncbi:MAG TPA: hypothetical protein VGK46_10735 [Saprospiraceae bacterium]
MKIDSQYLYNLLPGYYRVIDDSQGLPLKALLEVMAREGAVVEDHIAQLYENWFIETCEEWVVPYIGDLLGVKNINEIEGALFSRRAYVANTLGYRRRKGTAPILEQLALDVTGWRARVVEFFHLLGTNQHLNHVRNFSTITPDLRQMNSLDLLNSPFESITHNIDVGRISKGLGRYNISNLGIFLWRLQAYPIKRGDARFIPFQTGMLGDGYTFSPLGLDTQLFNFPQTEKAITHLAEEINVPALLRRRGLHDELERARQAVADGNSPDYEFLSGEFPAFQLYLNGNTTPIPLTEIVICNLSEWKPAPLTKTYKKLEADGSISSITLPVTAAVDPILGRITFSNPANVQSVIVDYQYGFAGDVGGGPYDRKSFLKKENSADGSIVLRSADPNLADWHVGVSKDKIAVAGETIHTTLQAAISEWNSLGQSVQSGLITIMDNRTYDESASGIVSIQIGEGKSLFIVAADWPEIEISGVKSRRHGNFNPENVRPHFMGDWEIEGTAGTGSQNGGSLLIDGILLEGKISVLPGNLENFEIQNATLVTYGGGLEVAAQDGVANFSLLRSISGPVRVSSPGAYVHLKDCIVDVKNDIAIDVSDGQLAIQSSTIWGMVTSQTLDAENSIFNDLLDIERRQTGCVRFSFVLLDSLSPRRYRCQPELEIQTRIKEAEINGPISNLQKQLIREQVINKVFPIYTANEYGHHAYAQLSEPTPIEITTGGENGAEMGVFNFLQQPQRVANLQIVLDEYLRLGLEAGIIYVT